MKLPINTAFCCLFLVSACSSSSNDTTNSSLATTTAQRLISNTFTRSDGTEGVVVNQYTQNGYLSEQTITEFGELDVVISYEHDSQGRFTRAGSDEDQDGVEDRYSTYQYDVLDGLSRIYRYGSDALINSVLVYSFENGLAVSRKFYDVDGLASADLFDEATAELEIQRFYEYENGRVIASLRDSDIDGVIDFREDYSYNLDGTLSSSAITNITDGTVAAETFVYETGVCVENFTNSASAFFCVGTNGSNN